MRTTPLTRPASAVSALTVAMLPVLFAAPAQSAPSDPPSRQSVAAPTYSSAKCSKGSICGWKQPNYKGKAETGKNDGRCWGTWSGDRSFSNQSRHTVRLYSSKKDCTGKYFDLKPGHGGRDAVPGEPHPTGLGHT